MTNLTALNQKLSNKFYLFSAGLYAAVASIFGFIFVFQFLGLNQITAIFIGYFLTVLWRAFYDQLIILELKIKQLNIKNNFILALTSACVLSILYYFIRGPLGDWAVPITIIISMKITGKIRKFLWPDGSKNYSEFLKIYLQKIQIYMLGLYGFFLAVALITYKIVKIFGLPYFYFAFAAGILIGLIFEQIYNLIKIYEIKLTTKNIFISIAIAIISSIFCTSLVFVFMQILAFSGKTATIIGIIVLKITQPLSFKFLIKN
ncbi:MAG: hypothetical protein WC436_03655 [Candidatus Babeliales bacterium]